MKLKTEKLTYPHFAVIEQAKIFGIFFRGVSELLLRRGVTFTKNVKILLTSCLQLCIIIKVCIGESYVN